MKCAEAQRLFSPYLDGAVTGTQMHGLDRHLQECAACQGEYAELRRMQQLLNSVGRRKAPADLGLKLRLAISREAAQARRPPFEGVLVRLENALNAFMVPATAGLASAVVLFTIFMMGILALPSSVQAGSPDVPLMLTTAPELEHAAFNATLGQINEDSLVIETHVDANGQVVDYKVLSSPKNAPDLLPEVKNMLIFTTFRPAMSMGQPMPGRAVLAFSKIHARG